MIDVTDFYVQLGATTVPGPDEQLMLSGETRVQASEAGWTVIFEGTTATAARMRVAMQLGQQLNGLVPFTTRSGHVAMKWVASSPLPETVEGLRALRAALRRMEEA